MELPNPGNPTQSKIPEKYSKEISILQRWLKMSSADGRQEAKGELIQFFIASREERGEGFSWNTEKAGLNQR